MDPPITAARAPWERGLKAREYTISEWEQHKDAFKQLYSIDDLSLPEVRETMAKNYNFYATEVQYKKKIKKWKLEKNIKKDEMMVMVNKRRKRKAEEGKETEFRFKGRPVEEEKFDRFQKRHKTQMLAPSPEQIGSPVATPSCIEYWTPRYSDPGTPMDFGSQRGGDTPRPMEYSTPTGDSHEQPVNHSIIDTITSQSPAMRSTSPAAGILSSPNNYMRVDHNSPLQPWGQVIGDSRISTNMQPRLLITANTNDSGAWQYHEVPNGTRIQGFLLSSTREITAQGTFTRAHNFDSDEVNKLMNGMEVFFQCLGIKLEDRSENDWEGSRNLVRHLGYNPLAIKLAGSYINRSKTHIGAYICFYHECMQRTLHRMPKDATDDALFVIAAFEVSFSVIERESKETADILLTCAYLHHENIMDELIRRGRLLSQDDPTVERITNIMLSYSLVERIPHGDGFSIDPIIHSWLGERLDPLAKQRRVGDVVKLIGNSLYVRGDRNPADWEFERRALPHIRTCWRYAKIYIHSELKVPILDITSIANMAHTMSDQGQDKEAEVLEVQVLDMRKRVLGNEHPGTLTAMASLANTYRKEGRLKEAEELEVKVLDMSKRLLGNEHPKTLTAMGNLAATYWKEGRLKEAEELQVQVLDMSKRLLGNEHPDTLTVMANLVATYRSGGRFKEAEELQVQVLDMRKRVLGNEHPDTLTAMTNLAATYWKEGRLKEAEELQVQVLDMSKRLLGNEHPDTLTVMANLVATYWNEGRLKEAEELEVKVLDMSKRLLGNEHPKTLTAMANLAATYWKEGRLKEAEELEVKVLDMSKRLLGNEHPDTLTVMANLAATYRSGGRFKEAEELQVQVLDMRRKVLGDDHPDTLYSLTLLYPEQGARL